MMGEGEKERVMNESLFSQNKEILLDSLIIVEEAKERVQYKYMAKNH